MKLFIFIFVAVLASSIRLLAAGECTEVAGDETVICSKLTLTPENRATVELRLSEIRGAYASAPMNSAIELLEQTQNGQSHYFVQCFANIMTDKTIFYGIKKGTNKADVCKKLGLRALNGEAESSPAVAFNTFFNNLYSSIR